MLPGTLVLLHDPLTGAAGWGDVPAQLRRNGHRVVVVDVTRDETPPFAARYVAEAALQIAAAQPAGPLVLVGHAGAGPLLAQVGASQRAARRALGGYVFLDARLPAHRGASRLDLLGPDEVAALREVLAARGAAPAWSDGDLRADVPDPAVRRALLASVRPRPEAFFTEPLPHQEDWPDAPCAYLQTAAASTAPARLAAGRGWPVLGPAPGDLVGQTRPLERALPTSFAACADPTGVADLIEEALATR